MSRKIDLIQAQFFPHYCRMIFLIILITITISAVWGIFKSNWSKPQPKHVHAVVFKVEAWTVMSNAILSNRWFTVLYFEKLKLFQGTRKQYKHMHEFMLPYSCCWNIVHITIPVVTHLRGNVRQICRISRANRPSYSCLFTDLAFEW